MPIIFINIEHQEMNCLLIEPLARELLDQLFCTCRALQIKWQANLWWKINLEKIVRIDLGL